MRAEELVRRAEQDVDAERGDVDRPVRRVVHGVGPRERARAVRELDDALARPATCRPRSTASGKATTRVRSVSFRSRSSRSRVVSSWISTKPTLQVEVVRELEPRRDVAVVVEARDEDLVAGRERPAERRA